MSVKDFGAVEGTDASDAFDAFTAFVLANPNLNYDISGSYLISRPWLFDHRGAVTINWNLKLTTTKPMQCALALEGTNVKHIGKISVIGAGTASSWATFTLDYGVVVSGCQGSTLPAISVRKCRFWGVTYNEDGTIGIPLRSGQTYKNNTMLSIDEVMARDCGGFNTGYSGGGTLTNLGFVANFSNPVRQGSQGVPSQRTTVNVDILPPIVASSKNVVFAVINDRIFRVMDSSGTSGGGTLSLYPWMPESWASGTIKYIFGGALQNTGNNGGPSKILKVDAIGCAISVIDFALYGATVVQNVAQFCSIALVIGANGDSLAPQSSCNIGVYTEAVYRNMVFIGVGSTSIINRYGEFAGAPFVNCEAIYAQPNSGNDIFYDGQWYSRVFMPASNTSRSVFGIYSKRSNNSTDLSITIGPESAIDLVYQRNSWTINLSDATDTNSKSGLDSATLKMVGTGARNAPTGSFTFNPPSGWTVNGGASAVFDSFYEPAEFLIVWNIATKNAIVRCLMRRGKTAAPNNGTWERGDIVYNTTPSASATPGWVCVTAGTPGTWKEMVNLAA